jgi:hypothetical protein
MAEKVAESKQTLKLHSTMRAMQSRLTVAKECTRQDKKQGEQECVYEMNRSQAWNPVNSI